MIKILRFIFIFFIISCTEIKVSLEDQFINSIEKVSPTVVSVSTESSAKENEFRFGSGLIISNDGYIITNSHVIESGELGKIYVTLYGGKKHSCQIIGIDKLTDIALLKINEINLNFTELNPSIEVNRGQFVAALGNPHNLFSISKEPTATIGIISGKNVNFGLRKSGHVYQNMIQTDATINRGNSGGPLINSSGEVIGINTFIVSEKNSSLGFGFSIPINRVVDVVEDLKEKGVVDRDWFTGISIREINKKYKDFLKINVNDGVIVTDVEKKSPGSDAGILLKDIIYKVNDKIVNSALDIQQALDEGYFKTNDEVDLVIVRGENFIDTKLKLIDPYNKKGYKK